MTCAFEGCDKPKMKTLPLCVTHRHQELRGKELTPIGSTHRGGKNKIEGTCAFEGCGRKKSGTGFCHTHNSQYKIHRQMWEVGTRKVEKQVNGGYSPDMTCHKCKQTKNWKSFVLGMEAWGSLCRDCHRKNLSKAATEDTRLHHSAQQATMDDLMAFLDNRTK